MARVRVKESTATIAIKQYIPFLSRTQLRSLHHNMVSEWQESCLDCVYEEVNLSFQHYIPITVGNLIYKKNDSNKFEAGKRQNPN